MKKSGTTSSQPKKYTSRDSSTNEKIQFDDKDISNIIKNKREADNVSRTNSSKKKAVSANASQIWQIEELNLHFIILLIVL